MIVDRYYYGKLNNREQAIYRAFYKGLMEHKKIIPIPVKGNLSEDVVMRIFSAITRDNPLIYYLNQSAFNVVKDPLGHSAFSPQYFYDEKSVKKYNKKIEETVNDLAGKLKLTEGTDYTVSYKNNKNAAGPADSKAPTIIVKGKGDFKGFKGNVRFTILPADLYYAKVSVNRRFAPFTSSGKLLLFLHVHANS